MAVWLVLELLLFNGKRGREGNGRADLFGGFVEPRLRRTWKCGCVSVCSRT